MKRLRETASQTAGPYVHIGLAPGAAGFDIYDNELGHDIAGPSAAGERISVSGRVVDGMGSAVKDVLIEVWQANATGVYPGEGGVEKGFRGWGRVIPDFSTGEWTFDTVKPGPTAGRLPGSVQTPHLNLWLVARGINIGLHTRMYFGDEDNSSDPTLSRIEWEHRRSTLVAERTAPSTYRFDIVLQGEGETVFFDV